MSATTGSLQRPGDVLSRAGPTSHSRKAGRLRASVSAVGWPLGTTLVAIVLWELGVRVFDVPQYVLPAPSQVLITILDERVRLYENGLVTLWAVLAGFALAIAVSVPLALLIVYSKLFERAVYPLLVFAQTVPKISVAPIFIVWFGFGVTPKVLIAFLICFFPIVIDTAIGLRSVQPEMVDLIRSMGGSRLEVFRRVRIPNALPYFFSGLKIAVTLAVVGAVVGEFVGSTKGLGFVLIQASSFLNARLLFAAIVVLTLIGVALFYLVDYLERLLVPWHVTRRGDGGASTVDLTNPSHATS
ncbi:MAG: ABC transporter permease [Acidimicrobiales bacterium]